MAATSGEVLVTPTGKLAANPRGAPGGGVQGWGAMDPFWPLSMMQGGEAAPGYAPHHLPHPTMPMDLHVTQPHYQYFNRYVRAVHTLTWGGGGGGVPSQYHICPGTPPGAGHAPPLPKQMYLDTRIISPTNILLRSLANKTSDFVINIFS